MKPLVPSATTPASVGAPVRLVLFGLVYAAMNLPFAYKYGVRSGLPPFLAVVAYLVGATVLLFLGARLTERDARATGSARWFATWVGVTAVLLAILMRRFDSNLIRVSRAPAIHDWLQRLGRGEFPYASEVMPSGFPGLFALALPFDRLGDVGFMQIAAFIVFAALCWKAAVQNRGRAWLAMVLLLGSPLFLFEVVTRSELFSNMTLVLLVLVGLERRPLALGAVGLGVGAGLALSTRAIVGLAYSVFVPWRFRGEPRQGIVFTLMAGVAFVVTWLPFAIWDPERFARYGPFAIQASYAPWPLLVACGALTFALGLRSRSAEMAYGSVALVLFGLIAALFVRAVSERGWTTVLLHDRFDISYFAFAQTFALYGLAKGTWGTSGAMTAHRESGP